MSASEGAIPSSIPVSLPDGRRKRIAKVMGWCQALAPEGQTVRFAFGVKKGIGSNAIVLLSWFSQVLLIFQQFRVVAVTDTAILVFKSGWFTRQTPKRLLQTLPREIALTPGRGGRLRLGSETVKVDPLYASSLRAYLAEQSG